MDIDGLLASTAMVDQGGARTLTDRGELVYDLAVLTEALRVRCACQVRRPSVVIPFIEPQPLP